MDNQNNDILADLNLDNTAAPEAAVEATEATARKEVDIGTPVVARRRGLPAIKRPEGFGAQQRESKFKLHELAAPQAITLEDGTVEYEYDFLQITLQEGVAAEDLIKSARSAATQANARNVVEDGANVLEPVFSVTVRKKTKLYSAYYVTRTDLNEEGAVTGASIYRVDGTLSEADTDEDAAS